ncbi:MAG: zinc-dependent peptidase [Burkholderiales bacterium]|nr:zinc-dependent peptidase [Burkholderiales bacterium]
MGLGHWFGRWRRARAVERQPIDDAQWLRMMSRFSFFRLLSAGEQRRLRELTALFLDRKPVSGAGGLEMTREMQLIIAAQACLLVLNLDLDLYDDWVEVIVYPDEFVVEHDYMDEDGVMHKVRAPLSGEAWEHGPVILSWRDAQEADGGDGYNVVLHEFAHKIDMRNGSANGFRRCTRTWTARSGGGLRRRLCRFGRRLDEREELPSTNTPPRIRRNSAVTSELFFERPDALHGLYPAIYDQLAQFYWQNPLARIHPAGIKPS